MATKEDFLSWDDDIDLDALLGDYTDYDDHCPSSNSSEEIPLQVHPGYQCPECNKILKTISGFRGHVTKQHNMPMIKANDHRAPVTSPVTERVKFVPPSNSEFEEIIRAASNRTLKKIKEDPMHQLFGESVTVRLAVFCSTQDFLDGFFTNQLKDIFNLNLCNNLAREIFYTKLHALRVSDMLQSDCVNLFIERGCCEKREDILNFIQTYVLDLPCEIVSALIQQNRAVSEQLSKELSDNDQQILFYIAGFIVRSLKKRSWRKKKEDRCERQQMLEKLTCESSNSSFIAEFDQWLTRSSRGGLLRPSDNFYLLVRELENTVRKLVDFDTMQSVSLNSCIVKEQLMDSFMVKHYMIQLFGDFPEADLLPLLEDIICIFNTVRGYAVARLLRKKLNAKSAKPSNSLRQALKAKTSN